MNVEATYDIVIFLKPSFYNTSLDPLILPSTQNQSTIVYVFKVDDEDVIDLSNWERRDNITIKEITAEFIPPTLTEETLVIDALFDFTLDRPLSGGFAALVQLINSSKATVLSIGAPSGLLATDNTTNDPRYIIRADFTLLTQPAPLACYFPENQIYLGKWEVAPLKQLSEEQKPRFTTQDEVIDMLKLRHRFTHKGNYGHGLLIAASLGMAGAAILSAQAALKSGIGLLSIHTPSCNKDILQLSVPEAMTDSDSNEYCFAQLLDTSIYHAVAVGPGLGIAQESNDALKNLILLNESYNTPLVIDADGINILASSPELYKHIKGAILTPHLKEFERLVGKCNNSYIRLTKAVEFAKTTQCFLILKDAYSFLVKPDGSYQLNPTGNAGMATAGSGDVLTGILLALRAQGYKQEESIILGSYIHGRAGELAAAELGEISLTAKDLVHYIPHAWKELSDLAKEVKSNPFS